MQPGTDDPHGEQNIVVGNLRALWNDPLQELRPPGELLSAARADINTLLSLLAQPARVAQLEAQARATEAEGWLRALGIHLRLCMATPAIAAALTVYGNDTTGVAALEVLEEILEVPAVDALLPAVVAVIPPLAPLRGDDLAAAGTVAQAIVDAARPRVHDDDSVPEGYYTDTALALDDPAAVPAGAEAEDAWAG